MTDDYLVKWPPLKALIYFVIPVFIGNLFQKFYTMVDSIVVGRFVGETAMAAIGASNSITAIAVCIAIGGGIGASVVISKYFGAARKDKVADGVATASIAFLVFSILLGVLGYFISGPLLRLLKTPAECLEPAVVYLGIYFVGLPFLFMYNVASSMFNAVGKSRYPLVFLVVSSVFNIFLDIVFVRDFGWGVAGVAWATFIAQGISAVLSYVVLFVVLGRMDCHLSHLFVVSDFKRMMNVAFPSIFQQSTVNIGLALVQSVVNSFGAQALAGFSAAMRMEGFFLVPFLAVANSISPYTAQNLGAARVDRVKQGYHVALMIDLVISLCILIVSHLLASQMITMFLGANCSEVAMKTGTSYIKFCGNFYIFMASKAATDGVLRGAGTMKATTIANFVNLGIRVAVAMIFAPIYGIQMVWIADPLGWIANLIISLTAYLRGVWIPKKDVGNK